MTASRSTGNVPGGRSVLGARGASVAGAVRRGALSAWREAVSADPGNIEARGGLTAALMFLGIREYRQERLDSAQLTAEQAARIRALATEFPQLWADPKTADRDGVMELAALLVAAGSPALVVGSGAVDPDTSASTKVIIVAVMRKMITTLNAMLRDNAAWQPQSA